MRPHRPGRRALTLAEIVISVSIVLLAATTVLALLPRAMRAQETARGQVFACAKVLDMLEVFNCMPPGENGIFGEVDPGRPINDYAGTLLAGVGGAPWEVPAGYRVMNHDLEVKLASFTFGLCPVPPRIARRLDSDFDEIRTILDQGGQVYYSNPMGTLGIAHNNLRAGLLKPNETRRLVIGLLGLPQSNTIPVLPWKGVPYHAPYPSPQMTQIAKDPLAGQGIRTMNSHLDQEDRTQPRLGTHYRRYGWQQGQPKMPPFFRASYADTACGYDPYVAGTEKIGYGAFGALTDKAWPYGDQLPNPPSPGMTRESNYTPWDGTFPVWSEHARRYAAIAWWWAQQGVEAGELPGAFLSGRPVSEADLAAALASDATRGANVNRLRILAHALGCLTRHYPFDNRPRIPVRADSGGGAPAGNGAEDPARAYIPENLKDGVPLAMEVLRYPPKWESASGAMPANWRNQTGHDIVLDPYGNPWLDVDDDGAYTWTDSNGNGRIDGGESPDNQAWTEPCVLPLPAGAVGTWPDQPGQPEYRHASSYDLGTAPFRLHYLAEHEKWKNPYVKRLWETTGQWQAFTLQRKGHINATTQFASYPIPATPNLIRVPPGLATKPPFRLDRNGHEVPVITHDLVMNMHENCLRLAMRFGARFPYDWSAPKPFNAAHMMNVPLLEWDVLSNATGSTLTALSGTIRDAPAGTPTAVQWRPITPQPMTVPAGFNAFNTTAVNVPWGDSDHFSLTQRFAAAERCRQLVVWSVDWQGYEDAESAPSAPVDASKYPVSSDEYSGSRAPRHLRSLSHQMNDQAQVTFRNPEKALVFKQDVAGLPTGADVTGLRVGKDASVDAADPLNELDMDYSTWDQAVLVYGSNGMFSVRNDQGCRIFSGLHGADRNNNGLLDRGPVPTAVRLRATTVLRLNVYDPRLPHAFR